MFDAISLLCLLANLPLAMGAFKWEDGSNHALCNFDFFAKVKVKDCLETYESGFLYDIRVDEMYKPYNQDERDRILQTVMRTRSDVSFTVKEKYLVSGYLQVYDGPVDQWSNRTLMHVDSESKIVPWKELTKAQRSFLKTFTSEKCAPFENSE